MDFIFQVPYIIRILAALGIILALYRWSKNLILALLAGITVISLWSGHDAVNILRISWLRFSSLDNLLLMAIILQVIWLSTQMKQTGVMQDLVNSVSARLSKRHSLAVLPALIGLLPMPGGALFSAPMVKDTDTDNQVSALNKTKINYWFRHIWEYWWPLYPGVLLALSITKLEIWQFMLLQLPLSLFSVVGGYFFLLKPLKALSQKHSLLRHQAVERFGMIVAPITIVIGIYFLIRLVLPAVSGISEYLPMIIAILGAQIFLQLARPLPGKKLLKIIISPNSYKLALIVALIRIYGAFIEARLSDGILLTEHVRQELLLLHIPILAVIMLIPFICGLTTGIAVGFVGASFPVVINLLGAGVSLPLLLSYTVVAYAFGYIGMMLSPLHVCHLVTNEYFKTNLARSIFQLTGPSAVVLAGSLCLFVLIQLVL
jgi:integral membrane protein (TIGR00529 family)